MSYLIGEIILYLLAALLVGVSAGWLLGDWRARRGGAVVPDLLPVPMAFAVDPPAANPRVMALESELLEVRARADALEGRSAAREHEIESLTKRLTGTERQVLELERERALQNRALQVLHQQLELAIERRAPFTARATGGRAG